MFDEKEGFIIRRISFILLLVLFLSFDSCTLFNFILPKSYRAEKLVEEGIKASRDGNWKMSLEYFQKAAKLVDNPRIYNDLGIAYIHLGDIEKAFYFLQKAVEREPDNLYFMINLAVAYDAGKRYGLALEIYDKVLQRKPDWKIALINKAYTLSNLKKIQDAIVIYKNLLESDPGNVIVLSSLAGLYARLGNFDKALDLYTRVLEKSNYPEIYLAMGAIYELKEDYDKALKYYAEAIRENPDFSLAYFLYGDLKITLGDIKEGLTYLEKSIEVSRKRYYSPEYIGGNYFVLAGIRESMGYDKEARVDYREAFSLYPALKNRPRPIDVDAMIGLAIFLKNSQKLDTAEKKVKEILAINNKDPIAYSLLGDIYYLKGEMGSLAKRQKFYRMAIENYQKSLSLDPDQADVYVKLGNIYFSQGNLEVVYYRQGKYHQAYLNFEEALKIDPNNPAAHLSLALLYDAKGEYAYSDTTTTNKLKFYSKAITELTIAISRGMENFYTDYLLGLLYFKRNSSSDDLKMAEYFVNKSLKQAPAWNSARYLLAMIKLREGEKQEADDILAKIKPPQGEDKSILTYLIMLAKRGG